jgi:hypothetical protein
MVIVGVGECLHTIVLMPLVADLAPAALRGLNMAVTGLSWWLGLALAPVLAPQLMGISPPATMLAAAAVGRRALPWPRWRSNDTSRRGVALRRSHDRPSPTLEVPRAPAAAEMG